MRITAVETICPADMPNLLWVRVHGEDGLTGLGELFFGATAVEEDIHTRIAPMILGQDSRRIEYLNRRMQPYAGFSGTGAEMRALSAVDVALWDLLGKEAGMPLCDLLGGRMRERIQVYNTCAGPRYLSASSAVRPENFGNSGGELSRGRHEDLEGFMHYPDELAASLLEMGIESMKIWPFDFAAGAADGADISPSDLAKGLAPFQKIRSVHGSRMRLKAELHGLWSLNAARKICAALDELDIDWIEDPIWMDRTPELATLASETRTPIAGGETLAGIGAFTNLIESGAVATPIIDITWGGGLTLARKVAALAEAHASNVAFHDCMGPVTLAVSTHIALAAPNVREQEISRGFYYGWYGDYVDALPPVEGGFVTVPEGPGLGMQLLPGIEKRAGTRHRISR
ncbi:mandelate racemase/muconate lactonizing enzyme family protein [Zhengella sp. ZM62]|uniref:mandelate racemase/muconate lactonizing enzyme family protein n=1 Tax=Zhengella sedimenti TaxID=3390035 RepID=UPI003976D3BA